MSAKNKGPISRRDFLKMGALFPLSFLLERLPFLRGTQPSPSDAVDEAWDPWKEIVPLIVKREEIAGNNALARFTRSQSVIEHLNGQFLLKGPFEQKISRVLLRNGQTFWQEIRWHPESSLLLLRSEFETPFRNKARHCGLQSEVRLHWIDKETRKVYTPFVASNGMVLYQQTNLSPVVLSSDCPGNVCSGYCDYTCITPIPPQGDKFCRNMLCVSDWWCLIRCGLGCAVCASFCLDGEWGWCIACAIANCGCGQCFSRRWTCEVCT